MTEWPKRPTLDRSYYKAHGLGNDYLVFEEGNEWLATPRAVSRVCDRHRGVGSDGIVVLLSEVTMGSDPDDRHARVALRMFNPDGGEFERSGNGLRILASYLARRLPGLETVDAHVGGSVVRMTLHGTSSGVHDVSCDMGRAKVGPGAVEMDPAALQKTDRGAYRLDGPRGDALEVVPVSIGNPHLVVLADSDGDPTFSEGRLSALGPFLAGHPALANGSNVQIAAPTGPDRCRALIWERGVGRTSASGTSACAVAVAMVYTGRRSAGVLAVEMPGGSLMVEVSPELDVVLRGPVEEVCEGILTFVPEP